MTILNTNFNLFTSYLSVFKQFNQYLLKKKLYHWVIFFCSRKSFTTSDVKKNSRIKCEAEHYWRNDATVSLSKRALTTLCRRGKLDDTRNNYYKNILGLRRTQTLGVFLKSTKISTFILYFKSAGPSSWTFASYPSTVRVPTAKTH